MFITVDILRKHKACNQGIKYVERFYPNGVEVIDIIHDRHINKDFLHWGREHLSLSEEEIAAYCQVCNIINTESFWYSQNVQDSTYISESKNIICSTSIFESEDVTYSSDIVGSDNVNDSKQIAHSSMIDTCEKIFKSRNIVESINVCNSIMVARSKNVIESVNVFDSSEIIRCDTVTDSSFCQDCYNIEHCMFCTDLKDVEYHIFNKPVDKNRYEMIKRQYDKYLTELLAFVREWPENLTVNTFNNPTKKFDDWYYPISEKFWKWVHTLPGFDSMLLYNITMLPEILLEK